MVSTSTVRGVPVVRGAPPKLCQALPHGIGSDRRQHPRLSERGGASLLHSLLQRIDVMDDRCEDLHPAQHIVVKASLTPEVRERAAQALQAALQLGRRVGHAPTVPLQYCGESSRHLLTPSGQRLQVSAHGPETACLAHQRWGRSGSRGHHPATPCPSAAHSIHAISSATQTGPLDHGTNRGTVLTETATLEAGHREHARSAGILRVLQPGLMRSSTDESCRSSHCREDRRDRRSRADTHRTYSPSTPRCPAGPIPARRMRRWYGPLQAHRARGSPSVRPTRAPRPACTCAAAPTPRTARRR